MKVAQQYMVRGLEHEFLFEQEYVEDVACRDEIDWDILEELHFAGPHGILPKDVAARLQEYGLTPWNVTRRILRMNDKLDKLIGQKVAEKRGKGWALTSFMRDAGDSTKEELLSLGEKND